MLSPKQNPRRALSMVAKMSPVLNLKIERHAILLLPQIIDENVPLRMIGVIGTIDGGDERFTAILE